MLCRLRVSWTDTLMALNLWTWSFCALLLLGCGSSRVASPPKAERPTVGGRAQTISWLRAEIDRVRRVPETESYQPKDWRKQDVSSLVGMTRASLEEALGQPDVCPRGDGRPCLVPGHVIAYALFHLSSSSIGGGPNLIIRLNEADVCTDAHWLGTK